MPAMAPSNGRAERTGLVSAKPAVVGYDSTLDRVELSALSAPLQLEHQMPVVHACPEPGTAFSGRYWTGFVWQCLVEQGLVVLPIAIYMGLFSEFVLRQRIAHLPKTVCALVSVTVGLAFFLEGLKLGVMPLGEAAGQFLGQRDNQAIVLFITFLIGVSVTFAEPAIGILKIEGHNVDPLTDPYLWALLNTFSEWLVLSIGCGVGLASMLGTLRLLKGWRLVPMLHWGTCCAIALTAGLGFGTSIPLDALALAWDCGAVTTGPVTVPLVLSLGAGLATSTNTAMPSPRGPDPTANWSGDHAVAMLGLRSLGIIALASIWPVITVHLLLWAIYVFVPVDEIVQDYIDEHDQTGPIGHTGTLIDAFAYGLRSVGPLLLLLLLLLKVVLRQQLPEMHVIAATSAPRSASVAGASGDAAGDVEMRGLMGQPALPSPADTSPETARSMPAAGPVRQRVSIAWWCFVCYVGLSLYNYGLIHGLDHIGNSVGNFLPEAMGLFGWTCGVGIVVLFTLLLGFGATIAEPGLTTFIYQVERLDGARFNMIILKLWVPVGVATGITVGVFTIVAVSNPMRAILLVLLVLYPVAAVMDGCAPSSLIAAAWDSAGVTTGEVTVPLVLSLGAGLARSSGVAGGFGLLGLASVLPITAALLAGISTIPPSRWMTERSRLPSTII